MLPTPIPALLAASLSLLLHAASPEEPVALDPAVWTTVGARVPSLELFDARGNGAADLAALVRTVDAGAEGPAKRTLLIRFASW